MSLITNAAGAVGVSAGAVLLALCVMGALVFGLVAVVVLRGDGTAMTPYDRLVGILDAFGSFVGSARRQGPRSPRFTRSRRNDGAEKPEEVSGDDPG